MNNSIPQKKSDASRVSYQVQMDDEKVQKREAKKLAKQNVWFTYQSIYSMPLCAMENTIHFIFLACFFCL